MIDELIRIFAQMPPHARMKGLLCVVYVCLIIIFVVYAVRGKK